MKNQFITDGKTSVPITKFLLCIDKENNQLYVMHREFPACLIYVEQTKTPINFVVCDLYEENKKESLEILTSESFKKELRTYFIAQATSEDLN